MRQGYLTDQDLTNGLGSLLDFEAEPFPIIAAKPTPGPVTPK